MSNLLILAKIYHLAIDLALDARDMNYERFDQFVQELDSLFDQLELTDCGK